MAKKVELKLVRSPIGCPEWMRVIVRTLALRKLNGTKVVVDNGAIRGMVKKVNHLVSLREVEE
jgi:large subunit ribosomal protein L30